MTTTYPLEAFRVDQPYAAGLRAVRQALVRQGLRTPLELDVTARIRHELGVGLAPCVVLYVDEPVLLLEAVVFHRGAALLLPQPLVVAGSEHRTKLLLRGVGSLLEGGHPAGTRDPLLNLHARMIRAVESIAEREGMPLTAGAEWPPARVEGGLNAAER